MSKLKIATYSGVIPSTTFIERLIEGVSQRDVTVYLFGNKINDKNYAQKNVIVSTYSGKLNKFLRLLWFSAILFLFKNKEKSKLDQWIFSRKANTKMLKIKCYPVLWHKPDVFHLQWAKSIEDWIWVQDFGIKLVISLRGGQINYEPLANAEVANLYKKFFPKVDAFHAVSKAIAQEAVKYGANPSKIKVIYSGLPPLQNEIQNNIYVEDSEILQLLSVGRNHWKKGYNYALQACAKLKKKGLLFHYTIIGAKNIEELEFLKNDLELNENVTFKDKIPFNQVINSMKEAEIILLPSVEEGIANVVLEAMQLGKMVLTTNCGGMDEIVQDGKNGFIIPARDTDVMADQLIMISQLSKVAKDEISFNAKKTIASQHSEEKMTNEMLALYNAVLHNKPIL